MNERRAEKPRPVLGFIGIHSGGRPNQAVSQNETVARLFEASGFEVRRASSVRRPSLRTAHQLLALLLWRHVDILVVTVFSGRSFWIAEMASRLGRFTDRRIVLFLHGGNLPVFGPEHRRWVERVFNRSDLVIAPSGFLAETFRGWGYDVRIIPNVLDIDDYEYRPRSSPAPNLLWMRTFHEHYNPLMAVRVFERISRVHPDATMTMGGADHGLLEVTRAEAERLRVVDRIAFPGYLDAAAKRAAFARHDLYLNTNDVDNMPVSLLEAAASGLVPIATEVGGIPYLLEDGRNGIVVPSGDDEQMARAVLDLLDDPARYAAMSAEARVLAERSAWPVVRELWLDELSRLVPQKAMR